MHETSKNIQQELEANIKRVGSINRKISRGDAINEIDFNEIFSTNSSLLVPADNTEAISAHGASCMLEEDQNQIMPGEASEDSKGLLEASGVLDGVKRLTFCDVINEARSRRRKNLTQTTLGPRQTRMSAKAKPPKKPRNSIGSQNSGSNDWEESDEESPKRKNVKRKAEPKNKKNSILNQQLSTNFEEENSKEHSDGVQLVIDSEGRSKWVKTEGKGSSNNEGDSFHPVSVSNGTKKPKSTVTTSASFRTRNVTPKWTERETTKFYKCLEYYGTDFTTMENIFKPRNRKQLKSKFQKEEKVNLQRVNRALDNHSKKIYQSSQYSNFINYLSETHSQPMITSRAPEVNAENPKASAPAKLSSGESAKEEREIIGFPRGLNGVSSLKKTESSQKEIGQKGKTRQGNNEECEELVEWRKKGNGAQENGVVQIKMSRRRSSCSFNSVDEEILNDVSLIVEKAAREKAEMEEQMRIQSMLRTISKGNSKSPIQKEKSEEELDEGDEVQEDPDEGDDLL